MIIRQGHTGLHFYFVISGKGVIKVVRRRADGSIMNGERVVFKIERGSSFGVSNHLCIIIVIIIIIIIIIYIIIIINYCYCYYYNRVNWLNLCTRQCKYRCNTCTLCTFLGYSFAT